MRTLSWRRLLVMAVALGALVLAATPSLGETFRIRARGETVSEFKWRPGATHAPTGSRIVWKNASNVNHRVVAYGGNWTYNKTLEPGEKVARRFGAAGTFRFRCTIAGHSTLNGNNCDGMCGRVVTH